jgi:hypothetical protein
MRLFYLELQQNEKLQPLAAEMNWTKNILIFTKCKDALEREFYLLHEKVWLDSLPPISLSF